MKSGQGVDQAFRVSLECVRLPWRATELLRKVLRRPLSQFIVEASSSSISAMRGVAFISSQVARASRRRAAPLPSSKRWVHAGSHRGEITHCAALYHFSRHSSSSAMRSRRKRLHVVHL